MNLNQYIKNRVQNILNERLIQKAQSNINNNIDSAAQKISSVIPYSSIVENIMSMHITHKQLQTLVCEAFKYFDTLPNVFDDMPDSDHYIDRNGYHQKLMFIDFDESFEFNIQRLMFETGPDDPDIRKMLTYYTYCCKWANIDPLSLYDLQLMGCAFYLCNVIDITTTFDLDYNYLTGVLKPDEFDITKYKCNSKTVIKLDPNQGKRKPIIIDNIFKKLFDEESFKLTITNEKFFEMECGAGLAREARLARGMQD
jgi:hypothetical protein